MHALKLNATINSTRRLLLELPAETPEGEAEVIVLVADDAPARLTDPRQGPEPSLEQVFAAIDQMPRKRLTKDEIDQYIAEERASWD